LAIRTPVGTVIHSGDFKVDHTPVDGRRMDLARFAAYGEQGVLALFSDSTMPSAQVPPFPKRISVPLCARFSKCDGRIIIAVLPPSPSDPTGGLAGS